MHPNSLKMIYCKKILNIFRHGHGHAAESFFTTFSNHSKLVYNVL